MGRILIFEPHVDDALLQCNRVFDSSYEKVYVVSLNSSDERSNHSYKLLNDKVIPIMLGSEELRYDYGDDFFIHPENFSNIIKYNYNLFKSYMSFLTHIMYEVDEIYIPLGLYHPHHIICNQVLVRLIREYEIPIHKVKFYIDLVYFDKLNITASQLLEDLSVGDYEVNEVNTLLKKTLIMLFSYKHITGVESKISKNYYINNNRDLENYYTVLNSIPKYRELSTIINRIIGS